MDGLSPSLPAPVAWLIVSRVFVGAAAGGATVGTPDPPPRSPNAQGQGWLVHSLLFPPSFPPSLSVVPMYIGEISPQHLRGALTSLNQFACVVAILVSQVQHRVMPCLALIPPVC